MDNIKKIIERLDKFQTERRLLQTALAKPPDDSDDSAPDSDVLEARLASCERSLRYTQKKIFNVLKRIKDPQMYNILEARIFARLTMDEIAEQMFFDVRTAYRLKEKAYREFNRIMNEMERTL